MGSGANSVIGSRWVTAGVTVRRTGHQWCPDGDRRVLKITILGCWWRVAASVQRGPDRTRVTCQDHSRWGASLPPQCVTCPASSAIAGGPAGEGVELGDLLPHLRDLIVEKIDCTLSAVVTAGDTQHPMNPKNQVGSCWKARISRCLGCLDRRGPGTHRIHELDPTSRDVPGKSSALHPDQPCGPPEPATGKVPLVEPSTTTRPHQASRNASPTTKATLPVSPATDLATCRSAENPS
jgi:hypothetical protein